MHCWAQYLFITLVAVLGLGSAVTACGQKGDLYLPERPAAQPGAAAEGQDVPRAPSPAGERGEASDGAGD